MKIIIVFLALSFVLSSIVSATTVSTNITNSDMPFQPGDTMNVSVYVQQNTNIGLHQINIDYTILHREDSFFVKRETRNINKELLFETKVKIPEKLSSGRYTLKITINNEDYTEKAFTIEDKDTKYKSIKYYFLLLAIIFVLIGLLIWMELKNLRKHISISKKK